MKKVLFLLVICMTLLLTGCGGDEALLDAGVLTDSVLETIPDSQYLGMEHQITGVDSFGTNIYTFTNDKFEFHVTNQMTEENGTLRNQTINDYFLQLIQYKSNELESLAQEYGFNFQLVERYSIPNEELGQHIKTDNLIFCQSHEVLDTNIIDFDFYIGDFENINDISLFLEEFLDLVEDEIPVSSNEYSKFNLDCTVMHLNRPLSIIYHWTEDFQLPPSVIDGEIDVNMDEGIDFTPELEVLRYTYADRVRNGHVINDSLTIDAAKDYEPMAIETLYIAGEQYASKRYNTIFEYDVEQGKYYTQVLFAVNDSDMEDYLQREIIESYYPYSHYIIDTEAKTSAWQINNDEFKVKSTAVSFMSSLTEYVFYKNGAVVDVDMTKLVSEDGIYYMSLDDWAYIMGMKVVQVDTDDEIIHLDFLNS